MAKKGLVWKKARGKLGILAPLLGTWKAKADSPMGPVVCTRTFRPILAGAYVQLTATWKFSKYAYEELAVFGVGEARQVSFWSFTSYGKRSEGSLANVIDIHPDGIGFEAHMPAGLARMAYWPDAVEGFRWAAEAKTKRGRKRFVEHHYTAALGGSYAEHVSAATLLCSREVKMPTKAKTAPKRAARTTASSAKDETGKRITVENVNVPGRTTQLDATMYQAMRRALLKVLPSREPGLTQDEMRRAVVVHLPNDLFPGGAKAGWWAKAVQLDLEAKGVLARETSKPLRWHRTTHK